MTTFSFSFQKENQKVNYTQTDAITVTSADGAKDGVAILFKVAGDSTNTLTFDSDFESLDGVAFDNTKMNHIYMVYDVTGNGTVPKTFYTIKQTAL